MPNVEKLVIIGSGPAGWTAAIYAARANLDPVLFEGVPKQAGGYVLPGGQLMLTTEVENYPGYPEGVQGPKMMADFKKQAARFETRVEARDVVACDFRSRPFELETASAGGDERTVRAHAVIVATGATANWLGLENEQRLARSGGGVSACAVCDGALPIFREQELVVVGGGDSAMEEASYLTKFASKVHIVHRRDELRASKIMQQRVLENPKCEVIWETIVTDVLGEERITGVRLKNVKTRQERDFECRGLFLAIGHTPATAFLDGSGLALDENGYLKLTAPPRVTTSVEGVFAAGDAADAIYRQAVTAAGMGCQAALDAERWLAAQGID
ncbi:MAG: thioredoxin-disulfide reductase [Planctomycetota bacterium]|jgi:thioredoxin reductase (NADPH)